MVDGLRVPGGHDGMAAFLGRDGRTMLVRNHELRPSDLPLGAFGDQNELLGRIDRSKLYDAGRRETPGLGGTTTLIYDTKERRLESHFLSLAGTHGNCAGGSTPWNSWITCEETVVSAEASIEKDHGYNFEVPASASVHLTDPVPIKPMGRFNHEAVAFYPPRGIFYQTEDREDGLLYRFIPESPGKLHDGGRLQALKVRDLPGADTRNWGNGKRIPLGLPLDVGWIDLEEVQSPADDLRLQGFTKGASLFARGEGIWYGEGVVYFACTTGGEKRIGQIWRYVPSSMEGTRDEDNSPGRLDLFVEADDPTIFENIDNLTLSPWGDLIVCEDAAKLNYLIGVTPAGNVYKLAKNAMNNSELAGATFSPDGRTLFINIQKPGLTLAITGPWISYARAFR